MTAWLSTCAYFLFALLLGRRIVRAFRPSAGSLVRDWSAAYLAGQLNTRVLIVAVLALLLADLALRLADPAARRRPVVGRAEVLTLIAFAAANGLIVATYALTPKDVVWHLATSARRLLLLPHLLPFLLIVFRLDRLVLPEIAAGRPGRSAATVKHAGEDTALPEAIRD